MNKPYQPSKEERDPLEEVFRECQESTKIVYNDLGFFSPKLRNLNYLSIGRSRMASNPLTIVLELLYRFYIFIRNIITSIWQTIAPKNLDAPVVEGVKDSHLVGQLVFAGREDENTPIHHMKVIFWARTWLFQWVKLAEGVTDRDGNFNLPFSLRKARGWFIFSRRFETYQTNYRYSENGVKRYHYDLFHTQSVPGSDLVGMTYNLRTIQLFYWEYDPTTTVPRVVIKNHDKDAPQYYAQGRTDAINQQVIPVELTKLKHIEQIAKDPSRLTIQKIQDDYPTNLTSCMEKKVPGITRGDEWFGLRMMNGMNAATFIQDPQNPSQYWTYLYGACNYDINDEYAFPTVDIKFELDARDIMMPKEIHLTGPLTSNETDPWKREAFTCEEGEKWLQAKRVARVTGALSAELDDHFTSTHLVTEQFAIAAYRNLRLSPIAALLFPHLKEVILVNHSANSILVGPADPPPPLSPIRDGGIILWLEDQIANFFNKVAFETGSYIPLATAITHEGINQRTRDLLGVQDWKGWKPMEPLSSRHNFPRAQRAFWRMLGEYLDLFFEENLEEIKAHWYEVYCFSNDLVTHSVPLYLSDVDLESLPPKERELAEQRLQWYQHRYSLNMDVDRDEVNGELKVLSPITHSEEFRAEDLDNLKEACRYIIMIATFMHSFVNEHQYDDIGEVLYSSLGLRFGDGPDGILAPESDTRISPDLTRSTQMMWFSNLLSRTEYGFIERNEEGDINPLLVKMLNDAKEEIEKNGMLIANIESRTNI